MVCRLRIRNAVPRCLREEPICDIIDELETRGFEIDVEILWRLKNRGYRVVEYPITWSHSEGSKFKLSQSYAMFFSLIKIRFQEFGKKIGE